MKTIFVTVEEMLSNNGEIPLETAIYSSNIDHRQIGEFAGLSTLDGEMITIRDASKSYPFYSSICCVKISCEPIYKIA